MRITHPTINVPERVQTWIAAAQQVDQTADDRNQIKDQVDWNGFQSIEGSKDQLERVSGSFDANGARDLNVTLTSTENFWRSRVKISAEREGDREHYTVTNQHPKDPEMFDYRAKFSKNLTTGAVENLEVRNGTSSLPELLKQWSSEPSSLAVLAGAGAVTGAASYLMQASLPITAAAALGGAVMAGFFLASNSHI